MPRRRTLSDDDRHVWHQLTETVTPLAPPPLPEMLHSACHQAAASLQQMPEKKPCLLHGNARILASPPEAEGAASYCGPPTSQKKITLPALAPGDLHSMDKRTAQRLKGGRMAIAARLDLHGLPAVAAQAAFEQFIISSHAQGHRCVLVITGKGQRSGTEGGVLKRELPHWLNLSHIRPLVLATTPAQHRDGGNGAVYVMLKRVRQAGR